MLPVETNIIIFEVVGHYTAKSLADKLKTNHILAFDISPTQIRMVFHLDISPDMVNKTIEIINNLH
jgi:threonine aldolase